MAITNHARRNRSNFNKQRSCGKIISYQQTLKHNDKTMEVYREYIKFIKNISNRPIYNKTGLDFIKNCEDMLNNKGYITPKMQDTLEHVFGEALNGV